MRSVSRVATGKQEETCPHCGGSSLHTVECIVGPHHSRTGCSDCGRFIRFNPVPWTISRARAFVMPFGKHRGKSLAELTRTDSGRGYVEWLAENVAGNVGTAAGVVLGIVPEDGRS
jgi:uncharacterized protein (DUF3820 family)